MAIVNPYINLPGTTEEAFNFYRSAFGGEFTAIQRFGETPVSDRLSPNLSANIPKYAPQNSS